MLIRNLKTECIQKILFNSNDRSVFIIYQNGDGQLSWSEFKKLGVIDCDEDKQMALEAFKEIDVDGDGQVSKAEFVKIMSKFDCAYKIYKLT